MARRIGIVTAGGDCPGINAVIRAVTKTLLHELDAEVVGFHDGYDGVVRDRWQPLDWSSVSGILTLGGTILGTSNKADPFRWTVRRQGGIETVDRSDEAVSVFRRHGLEGLVVVGGDGSMAIAHGLGRKGVPVVGVPKTIDNDIRGTERTFGFASAVAVAAEALDRLHTTASAHHRIMVAEVMGRYAGWIALHAGVAGGADVILLPELPFRWEPLVRVCRGRAEGGRQFSIVCVAEGARPEDGERVVRRRVEDSTDPVRLGGVGELVARRLEEETGIEARATTLGYVQRGGSPCADDRVFASLLGHRAARLVETGAWGRMVALQEGRLVAIPLEEAAGGSRLVPPDEPLVAVARATGAVFGDEHDDGVSDGI